MGLYGTILVEPAEASYWPAADRQLTVTLDDVLIEDGHVATFRTSGPTYTAMGRYGNVMLVNGETRFVEQVAVGEVVRLNLVNTANTRIFNVALAGARMKLVGGDSGRYERETFAEEVRLSPSERAIVDVLFEAPGDVRLEHRPPGRTYLLGSFTATGTSTGTGASTFDVLRTDPELAAEREALAADLDREPDEVLGFTALMPLLYGAGDTQASSYTCPMHPEIVRTEPGTCPKCQMKLVPSDVDPATTAHGHGPGGHGDEDTGDGLEWEDLMVDINRRTDTGNMVWKLVDRRR